MTENRHMVSTGFETFQTGGAEVCGVGRDLTTEQLQPRCRQILLVDDDESLRSFLRTMLELAGYQVTEASNGAEALNLFTLGEFELVITDFEMPVMDGNKLAIGIKLLAPSTPILMITGSERARRDTRNPVDALLNKPFEMAELHGALGKLLWARSPGVVPTPEIHSMTFDAAATAGCPPADVAVSCCNA